jgi:hypothetical protein
MQNDFYPAIIFSFGKRECENNALQMGKVTLNNGKLFRLKKLSVSLMFINIKHVLIILIRGRTRISTTSI